MGSSLFGWVGPNTHACDALCGSWARTKGCEAALAFRRERDWEQLHNPKDLAISLSLEAFELLELFQWSGAETMVEKNREKMAEELADVLVYCVYFADALGIDIPEAMLSELAQNERKYPVEKARGSLRKYTEL